MARNKSTGKSNTADLRAMRDQRAAELADPTQEAQRHEASFLANLSRAQSDFEWLAEHQAWILLGFASLAEWWEGRVRPVLDALALRPAPEMAQRVVEMILAAEAELPTAQRRSKKELAALVGASAWKAYGREDHRQRRSTTGADLDSSSDINEQVGVSDPRPTGPEESETPPSDSSTPNPPAPVSEGVQPIATAHEREPGSETAAGVRAAAADESRSDTRAVDSPETGDGGVLGVVVSGHSHPSATGEAPADEVEPSASGAGETPSDVGEASGDETAGGLQAPGLPAVDPAQAFDPAGLFADDMRAARAKARRWLIHEIAALGEEAYDALTDTKDFYVDLHDKVTSVLAGVEINETEGDRR